MDVNRPSSPTSIPAPLQLYPHTMDVNHLSVQSLLSALPDQDLELFNQTPALVDFHFFPKLPLEIRLKIWNYARKRNVLVYLDHKSCLRTRTPSPTTFRINHESRTETTKHYPALFYLHNYTSTSNQNVPALHQNFFDAKADVIYCSDQTLKALHRLGQEELFDFLCPRLIPRRYLPEDFSTIRYLQVRRRDWLDDVKNKFGGPLTRCFRRYRWKSNLTPKDMRPWSKDQDRYMPGFFSVFRGLEELTILGGGLGLRCIHEAKDCCDALEAYYGFVRAEYSHTNLPKVSVHLPGLYVDPKAIPGRWACVSCYPKGTELQKGEKNTQEEDQEASMFLTWTKK